MPGLRVNTSLPAMSVPRALRHETKKWTVLGAGARKRTGLLAPGRVDERNMTRTPGKTCAGQGI